MPYNITLASDSGSWINRYLVKFINQLTAKGHRVSQVHDNQGIKQGDLLFILSYSNIIPTAALKRNRHNLVVHESALPKGKGWSPLTWQILEGKKKIPITLFEAASAVDSGSIYLQDEMLFDGTELVDELRKVQAEKTLQLCMEFIGKYPRIIEQGKVQIGTSTFYQKRTPRDSQLDINKNIKDQFNLLRVVDNQKYPAFFEYKGVKYVIKIKSSK